MSVLLFDVFKHLPLRKIDVRKTCRKSKFLGKKIAPPLKSKMVQGILGKRFILALLPSAVFRLEKRVSDFFIYFFLGDKRLSSEFLRKFDFRDIMNVSPKILAKN